MKKLFTLVAVFLAFAGTANAQFFSKTFQEDPEEKIYLDIPVIDLPYQINVASATGNPLTAITNQSMATTLALCEDFQVAAHYGIRELFGGRRVWSKVGAWGFDMVSMFMPFGSSWCHEEYHRAVMGLRGVESYDEVWNMKFFGSSISVSHETDEAMANLHDNYINDFIRMNAAGLEGQTHLVQRLQRNDFFDHRTLMNGFSYWSNILNNWGYLSSCADPESDADIEQMNAKEPTIKSRDFTGFDLSAWAYELFHPGVTYADRGIHPSGEGINRYITYDMIGDDGVQYLKVQARRELLNLISPMMLGIRRIRLTNTLSGPVYGNFAARHYLTHYGDDISLELMFETPWVKFIAAPHMYSNYVSRFPGFELAVYDQQFMDGRIKLDATAQMWSQPEDFTSDHGKFGGMISADASYVLGRLEPYVELSAKTAGWLVGDVNLDSNISLRAGLRWLMFDGSR